MKTIENLWFLEIDQSSFKYTVPVTETLLAYRLQLYQPHVCTINDPYNRTTFKHTNQLTFTSHSQDEYIHTFRQNESGYDSSVHTFLLNRHKTSIISLYNLQTSKI